MCVINALANSEVKPNMLLSNYKHRIILIKKKSEEKMCVRRWSLVAGRVCFLWFFFSCSFSDLWIYDIFHWNIFSLSKWSIKATENFKKKLSQKLASYVTFVGLLVLISCNRNIHKKMPQKRSEAIGSDQEILVFVV